MPDLEAASTEVLALGFEPVATAFAELAATDHEGMAFAAVRDGEVLVSLAAGISDSRGSRFERTTLLPIFSGTKGIVAAVIARLVEQGRVDYEAPLSHYWPAAARWVNPTLTVAHCLSHRSGLPHIDPPTTQRELWDADLMLDRLAHTEQIFPAGSAMAYQGLTYGWFAEAIVRAVDGRSLGRIIAEELAGPFGLDLHLGIDSETYRLCGKIVRAGDYRINVFAEPGPLLDRVYGNPRFLETESDPWNDLELVARELPGGGAVATAEAMASFYDLLLNGRDGRRFVSRAGVDLAWQARFDGVDAVTRRPLSMSMGYERDDVIGTYAPLAPAFGHSGAGGSVHGCWPEVGTSFSFLPRLLRTDQHDGRSTRLLAELARCLTAAVTDR